MEIHPNNKNNNNEVILRTAILRNSQSKRVRAICSTVENTSINPKYFIRNVQGGEFKSIVPEN